ncbi:MAG: glycosyltransferase family 4 protein [Chloroflexi bacterium]|nr:glycosyltransferase family 4 protein [Chloroflexota bacterium]
MRLAYFSPLNPAPSGISDYSLELLPHLAAHADITLVVDGYAPTDPELKSFRVIDDRAYTAREFDSALYHLGNSPTHAYVYRRALQEPSVIVLHDLVLHHLVAWLTINHGDVQGYIAAMGEAYGEHGAALAQRQVLSLDPLNWFDYPLSEAVVKKARGVIAHSRYVADAVKRFAPNVPVAQIPHEMPDISLVTQGAARRRLNLPQNVRLIGTFGNLGPTKRTTVLLDAFRAARREFPDARLLLVGAASPNFDIQGLIDLLGLRDVVQFIGYVPFDAFHTYMAAMAVCVNLRYPTAGETSGAVLRMMALAKPVVVSRVGWFAELPENAVAKIDVDDHETEQLTVILRRLLDDPELDNALGENARQYVIKHCAVSDAARYYAEFLCAVLEGGAESKVYGEVQDGKRETGKEKREARSEIQNSKFKIAFPRHSSPVTEPALSKAKEHPSPVPLDWRDEIARAHVALGLDADDAVLEKVARAIVELGLSE